MIVAQLTVSLLLIQNDLGSNPVIGNFNWTFTLLTVCRKDEKEAGNIPFLKLENTMVSPYKVGMLEILKAMTSSRVVTECPITAVAEAT